jgi:hypothetical protein
MVIAWVVVQSNHLALEYLARSEHALGTALDVRFYQLGAQYVQSFQRLHWRSTIRRVATGSNGSHRPPGGVLIPAAP